MGVASFALSEYASLNAPSFNFYWPLTRAWELLAGSLCALVSVKESRTRENALSALGLLLIVGSIFLLGPQTRFPSAYALAPVTGSCLVILFAVKGTYAARLLSMRPMVVVGLLSYSAYLWHQPLFAFARIRSMGEPDHIIMAALTLAILPLAYLSWRFVETPFRTGKPAPLVSRSQLTWIASSAAAALAAFGISGHLSVGFPARLPADARAAASAVSEGNPRRECIANIGALIAPASACRYGVTDKASVAILGDSHANSIAHTLGEALGARGAGLAEFSIVSCPPALGVYLQTSRGNVRCDVFNRAALHFILNDASIKTVVLLSRWARNIEHGLFDNKEGGVEAVGPADIHKLHVIDGDKVQTGAAAAATYLPERIRELVAMLTSGGKNVVLVYTIPEAGWSVPHLLFKASMFGADIKRPASTSHAVYLQRNERAHAALDAIDDSDRLLRVRPDAVFCNVAKPGRCLLEEGKSIFYLDDDHLNTTGARLLSMRIADQIAERGWLK